jgi:choline dehydrogenase-like flavoprotein
MYGCPYGLIYDSASTVDEMTGDPRFHYISGVVAERISEKDGGVEIECRTIDAKKKMAFRGERVFLACGAVQSTRIIMASKGAFGTQVGMKDSQYFMVPVMRFRDTGGVMEEKLHTLAQAFIEISDGRVSKRLVHLQVYTYNELMLQVMKARFGLLYPLARLPIGIAIGRMLLIQGFVHSDSSPKITMTLEKSGKLVIRSSSSPEAKKTVDRIMAKLLGISGSTGFVPLLPMLSLEMPGKSFHYGSSLPMSQTPGEWESDTLGRPKGFRKVHVVDSSVLPSLPAPTVTFTVMANAYRIGTEYDAIPRAIRPAS